MPLFEEFPTCYLCRSIDLEIVHNDDFGPMSMCSQCGYSWVAQYKDLTPQISTTKAS